MKTKNLIIGLLTITIIILSFLLYRTQSDKKSISVANKESQFDKEEKYFLCAEELNFNDGTAISLKDARDAILAFQKIDSTDSIRAFHVGLGQLDSMLKAAKDYNDLSTTPYGPIVGFRFYRGVTTRAFSTTLGRQTIRHKIDLVIFPTLEKEDLHDLDPTVKVPIFSHTRPCPKLCGN